MSTRSTLIALFATSFILAAPAYADGKGKGPTHVSPAPLSQPVQKLDGGHNCCNHTHTPANVVPYTRPVVTRTPVEQIMTIDTSSFTGGVGVGVNDVFVGGGGFFGRSGFRGSRRGGIRRGGGRR